MDFRNVIIMSDLDGTLLDDKKEISPRDMESDKRLLRQGRNVHDSDGQRLLYGTSGCTKS